MMPSAGRALCAICDDTNNTTAICTSCRSDPANADWCERPSLEDTTEHVEDFTTGLGTLVTGHRLKPPTDLERRILALLMITTRVQVRRYRRRNGITVVEQSLTMRQIAEQCGCSAVFVFQTKRRYFR